MSLSFVHRLSPMRALLVLLTALVLAAPALAQGPVPDTTDWRRYVPLKVGNQWQYHVTDDDGLSYYHGYEITHTVTLEGQTYYVARECQPGFCFTGTPGNPYLPLRYDTAHAFVARRYVIGGVPFENWWEKAPCTLDAPFDAPMECTGRLAEGERFFVTGGGGYELVLPPDTVSGVTYKQFDSIGVVFGVVAGFGVVSRFLPKNGAVYERLVWARVGGEEYGTAAFVFPPLVAAEPEPGDGGAFALTVSPNPVWGRALVSFFLPSGGQVRAEAYDALGRRVLTEDLGVLGAGPHARPLDLSGLAPGLVTVRLTVAGRPLGAYRLTVAR